MHAGRWLVALGHRIFKINNHHIGTAGGCLWHNIGAMTGYK
jgi:hypothetical protein